MPSLSNPGDPMPMPAFDEAYRAAPARLTSPVTVPTSEAQVRAVAFALKASGLPLSGPGMAATAAGAVISEVCHYGYRIVPRTQVRDEHGNGKVEKACAEALLHLLNEGADSDAARIIDGLGLAALDDLADAAAALERVALRTSRQKLRIESRDL